MHELSIVIDLVELCEQNLKKEGLKRVEKIEIGIGRLSGVEPHYLKEAFEVYKVGTVCAKASLKIDIDEIVVSCKNCHQSSTLKKNEFLCPKCGSNDLEVVSGEDMILKKITMS